MTCHRLRKYLETRLNLKKKINFIASLESINNDGGKFGVSMVFLLVLFVFPDRSCIRKSNVEVEGKSSAVIR